MQRPYNIFNLNGYTLYTHYMYSLKSNTDIKTAMSVYYAYAFAWLKYGIILWGNSTDANDLFIMLKKFVRILIIIVIIIM